ncbi:ATP-binding protein [Aliikangiella maris]|uniref:ATP-binding protein n=2 Tax=Aliikangiella maris TaxID=3162458 RepID=A0ABV2BPU7_9GAMM
MKTALISFFLLILGSTAFAKKPKYFASITEDNNHYIYFSTYKGIVQFDGHNYINLSDVSSLPSTWSDSSVYREDNNTLYVAYFKDGIWAYDLTNNVANKISNLNATKLVLSKTHLMTKVDQKLFLISLSDFQVQSFHLTNVLDIAAINYQHFAITNRGLYQIGKDNSLLLNSFQTTKANLALLEHQLIYSTDNTLKLLSLDDNTQLAKRVFENEITAITPYLNNTIAIAHNNKIDIINNINLATTKTSINQLNQTSRLLFKDTQGNLWSTDKTQFEVIDPNSISLNLPQPSNYNVVEMVGDQLWLGTEHGIYSSEKGLLKPLTKINSQLPKFDKIITDIHYIKNKPIIISTTEGAYKLENNTLTKIYDGYVLSVKYIRAEFSTVLIISTSKGVFGFDPNFEAVDFKIVNNELPNKEVLSVSKIDDVVYFLSAGGLVEKTQNKISVSHISQHNLTDIFAHRGNIYVTTWGGGVLKKTGNIWEPIKSPSNIASILNHFDEIFVVTSDGLYRFNKDKFTLVPNSAGQMFIANSLTAHKNFIYASSKNKLITLDALSTTPTNLPHFTQFPEIDIFYTKTITISANSFDYINGHIVRYQYQLNNSNWIDMNNGKIQLSYLNNGFYDVKIRASYDGIQWQESSIKSFNVIGPWYRSSHFVLTTTLVSFIILIFGLAIVFKINRQRNKVFKKISQQKEKQKLVATYAQIVQAKNALQQVGEHGVNHAVRVIENAIVEFEAFLDNITAIKTLTNSSLKESLVWLEVAVIGNNIKTEFQLSLCDRCTQDTRNSLLYIIHALVLNSVQHAKAKFIQMSVNCENKEITICVRDDGIGIKYFDYIFNFGVGFATIKNIIYERKGRLKVRSNRRGKAKGTFITVTVPYLPTEKQGQFNQQKKVSLN